MRHLESLKTFFLFKYQSETIELRKKANILLLINTVAIIFLALNIVIVETIIQKDTVSAMAEVFLIAVFIASIVLLRAKYYSTGSTMTVIGTLLILSAIVFMEPSGNPFAEYKLAFFLAVPLMLTCLLGFRRFQPVLVSCIAIATVLLYFFLKAAPGRLAAGNTDVSPLIISLLILTVCGFFSYRVIAYTKEVVAIAEAETRSNINRMKSMENVLISSTKGIEIGNQLIQYSSTTLESIRIINEHLQGIYADIKALNARMAKSTKINTEVVVASKQFHAFFNEQNTLIAASSDAVEEMTNSIHRITESALGKKTFIDSLVKAADEGEQEMNKSLKAIDALAESISGIVDILKVIDDISERTNLLAMNAAIEAAHAGEHGKGFAVVAGEIRKLAENANHNTRMINESIKKNILDIKNTAEINKRAGTYFNRINSEIAVVARVIEEILSGMNGLSSGTKEVLGAVSEMVKASSQADEKISEVNSLIGENSKDITEIQGHCQALNETIGAVLAKFQDIVKASREIERIGNDNILNISQVKAKIDALHDEEVQLAESA